MKWSAVVALACALLATACGPPRSEPPRESAVCLVSRDNELRHRQSAEAHLGEGALLRGATWQDTTDEPLAVRVEMLQWVAVITGQPQCFPPDVVRAAQRLASSVPTPARSTPSPSSTP